MSKRIKIFLTIRKFAIFVFSSLILLSCVNMKKATYFNGVENTEFVKYSKDFEPVLRENDLLSISVTSINPQAAEMFNVSNVSATQTSTATGATNQASGYLIDPEGFIRFPFLGKLKAAGKTKQELREDITQELVERKLLLEPIISIRYLNFKVSVLGEVKNPSVLTIPNEKVTLLEALGLAGDLTIYAKRDNVLLIREKGDKTTTFRIDLTSDSIFTSPNYYLDSNDIIYVSPNKSKVASTGRALQWLPVIFSIVSLAIIGVDRL